MPSAGKVVLFYPPYDGPALGAPLCLLALASPLIEAGFEVALVDAALTPDYRKQVLREIQNAVCLGVSVLTGPMIRSAMDVSRQAKALRPDLWVVWGGWHPSLATEQTLQAPFIDAVVRGQGELTLVELLLELCRGGDAQNVRGVSQRSGERIVHAPERRVANINDLPAPAYHLPDYDAYERASGIRKLAYATSVGCPYACHYCTDQVFYKRRFNAYPAERVVREMTDLAERYRIAEIALLDSNFPVDVKRAIAIAQGLVESVEPQSVRFRWTFQASTDFLCRMSEDEVRLLAASGVTHMGFGTESASPDVLLAMNKRHQRVDHMYETARKAELGGIHVTYNLIFGYPGESEADRIQTLRIMGDIARRFENVSFSPNIFTPYPGIPIWPELRALGVREPQTLDDWADLPLGRNVLPWLGGEELRRLRRMLEFFLLNNQIRKATRTVPRLRRTFRRALGAPVRWRLRQNRLSFPWELWVARGIERLVTRRSLLTGQQLSGNIVDVC